MIRALLSLAFLLAPSVLHAAAPAPSATNLLLNPGFEQARAGIVTEWDTTAAGMPTVFFGRDSVIRHSGSFSVSVANVSNLLPMWHNWTQTLLVGPELRDKDAVLSVWTRSNGVSGRGYVLLQAFIDTATYYARTHDLTRQEATDRLGIKPLDDPVFSLDWQREYFVEPNTDWVRRELRIHVPPRANVVFVRLGILGTGQVFFDDASLTAVRPRRLPPLALRTNLLEDAGFEKSGLKWELSIPPYSGLFYERDTTVAHSGRASMRLSGDVHGVIQSRLGLCQVISRADLGNKRFRFTGWCKTDSLTNSAHLRMYCHTPEKMVTVPTNRFTYGTCDWTRHELEFTTPPGAQQLWVWGQHLTPSKGTVWWDDFSLEYLGPAPPAKPKASAPAKQGATKASR